MDTVENVEKLTSDIRREILYEVAYQEGAEARKRKKMEGFLKEMTQEYAKLELEREAINIRIAIKYFNIYRSEVLKLFKDNYSLSEISPNPMHRITIKEPLQNELLTNISFLGKDLKDKKNAIKFFAKAIGFFWEVDEDFETFVFTKYA